MANLLQISAFFNFFTKFVLFWLLGGGVGFGLFLRLFDHRGF